MSEYYNKKIECMTFETLKNMQLKLFNQQLKRAQHAKAYQGKLPDKITDLSQIKTLPFTTKDDLRKNFPNGFCAVPKEEIKRFSSSSGTTGIPTLVFFTQNDLDVLSDRAARQFYMVGLRKGDICQCLMGYGLFTGGFYHTNGVFKLGTVLPTGSGNTQKQIFFLKELKAKFCFSTPGYLQYLLSQMSTADLEQINLKTALTGGEHTSPAFRQLAQEKYNIEIYESCGMSETGGPIAQECSYHQGMHVAEDQFYIEIINPDTGEVLPDGEYGELVITTLQQEAMPLIRYRTRDITRIIPGTCPCGRTHRRIAPITHRIDDMLIINGVNVFPSQIEECIYKHINSATNYLIHIKENKGLKKLLIDIELPDDLLNNATNLEKELITTLKSYITVTPMLNFVRVGTLPEIQGKAKRIIKD